MGTLCKTSNSLYTVLLLNVRGKLRLNRHDFLVLHFCVANFSNSGVNFFGKKDLTEPETALEKFLAPRV